MSRLVRFAAIVCLLGLSASDPLLRAQPSQTQSPEKFFGFRIGTDGELARYPRILEYLQHLAKTTNRLKYEEVGRTTMDNPYVLATISSPENLAKLPRLIEINRRLADARTLPAAEAKQLAQEGRVFYFVYGTIHSTEVGNTQSLIEIAHRLATENSADVRQVLDNAVILLVPSQNPDGQYLVVDHWYKTKGTPLNRVYPDLYHKYTGHDDNRDWFMFTQKETRLAIGVHRKYKPQITHDMHQMGSGGARIFVPPYDDPYDPNIHPILAQGMTAVGQAMASALIAEGKSGVEYVSRYDLWAPARQYMVYHGQQRILTEIASVNLADPLVNANGAPLGPQEPRWNFLVPYRRSDWRLRDIVDYGNIVAFAGMSHVAKNRVAWLENFYKVHADWAKRKDAPYAFVIPANQRDPHETQELLRILQTGEVEIRVAAASFTAGGKQYPAGSHVVRTAQPYGAFAKTMLERQRYPDLRLYPGGPPKPPYDIAGHTLGMLMGVQVDQIEQPFEANLIDVAKSRINDAFVLPSPAWAYLIAPESNAAYKVAARLQAAKIPVLRAAAPFESGGRQYAAGTWIVPSTPDAKRIVDEQIAVMHVAGADRPVSIDAFRLKPQTRIGLWRGANNMPGGWTMWTFEQYRFNHRVVSAHDFEGDLSSRYDAIVLPDGISRNTIVNGLDPKRHDKEWSWAYGVADAGWKKLADWVRGGGTLVAIGSAVPTAIQLLDLPIEPVLPSSGGRRGGQETLQFYCPGSLLQNQFNPSHPVAFGMPAEWPVFFESDQAYRLKPSFTIQSEVVGRYPKDGRILQSGWLLGEDLLRDQANVVAFRVGRGYVVTAGTQVDFRAQPRATFKILFNAIFHGPSTRIPAAEVARLAAGS